MKGIVGGNGRMVDENNDCCCCDCGYCDYCGVVAATNSSIDPSSAESYRFHHCDAAANDTEASRIIV